MNQKTIEIKANVGKEIAEISSDFTHPIEVVRESLHNSYDAGATRVDILAEPQTLPDGRRVLSLEFRDNGIGMSESTLNQFFGLGYTEKPPVPGRRMIGVKGHGTKIFYQAQDVLVQTREKGGPLIAALVQNARTTINSAKTTSSQEPPRPECYFDEDAERLISNRRLTPIPDTGTAVKLTDFTPDSSRLIDSFDFNNLENYLRWFTVYGSFEHVVYGNVARPPFELFVRGTKQTSAQAVTFGFNWPEKDCTELRALKKLDERRPFNYFCKSFRFPNRAIEDGYRIDIAVLFEGKRSRMDRDKGMSRQRAGGIYAEEERYGLWLCKDFIPIEPKFEWLLEEDCPRLVEDLRRPLILVNSQDFSLIANRGSVGNSPQQLLVAVKRAIFTLLNDVQDDNEVVAFLNEYQEDLFSRQREKDQKALGRRIDRFNKKEECEILLSTKVKHTFFEPKREITLFGLVAELQVLDPFILNLEILDYDDHTGIDLLVRRNGSPSDLLDRNRVAYVELKYVLTAQINHAFDHLFAVICWESDLNQSDIVRDAANNKYQYEESKGADGMTIARLVPLPDGKLNHNVRVILLKKLLLEKFHLKTKPNSRTIAKTPR